MASKIFCAKEMIGFYFNWDDSILLAVLYFAKTPTRSIYFYISSLNYAASKVMRHRDETLSSHRSTLILQTSRGKREEEEGEGEEGYTRVVCTRMEVRVAILPRIIKNAPH